MRVIDLDTGDTLQAANDDDLRKAVRRPERADSGPPWRLGDAIRRAGRPGLGPL